MADDPLKEAAKVIPSVYYDLIARVAAGAAVIAAAAWLGSLKIEDPSEHLVLLTLGAYICGMLLTPFGALTAYGAGKLVELYLPKLPRCKDLKVLPEAEWAKGPNDLIAAVNVEAGATIAKMQAEATLCHNMFVGILALPFFGTLNHWEYWKLAAALLAMTAVYRTGVYLVRQKQLYDLTEPQRRSVNGQGSATCG